MVVKRQMSKLNRNLLRDTGSHGFLNLPDHNDYSTSKVIVVPFGLEKSVTFGGGTSKGPQAIIHASHEVELFDENFKSEPYKRYGISTLTKFQIPNSHTASLKLLANLTAFIMKANKFPLILGGEHSLSGGSIAGVAKAIGARKFNILHFDAHSDLRPSFEGNPLSHASAMYLTLPYCSRMVQLGIRNMSAEEQPLIKKLVAAKRLKIFSAEDIMLQRKPGFLRKTLGFLKSKLVWLSFDVDAFDPSIIGSSTGTPEPGGLGWYEVVGMLRAAAQELNIIGAEFVELLPKPRQHAPDFAVAKLIYKFLNFRFAL